jgi:hypothetical protein
LVVEAILEARTESAMPVTDDDTLLPFSLPSLCKKKITAAFDGGLVSSDGVFYFWQLPTSDLA